MPTICHNGQTWTLTREAASLLEGQGRIALGVSSMPEGLVAGDFPLYRMPDKFRNHAFPADAIREMITTAEGQTTFDDPTVEPKEVWVTFMADGGAWAYHFTDAEEPEPEPPAPEFTKEQLDWLREHAGLDDDDLADETPRYGDAFKVPQALLADYRRHKATMHTLERQLMSLVPAEVRQAWHV